MSVSIIIPIYNVEKYVSECIASACNQTYRDLEIILVDDGSTDRSSQICDEWVQQDARIRVIHKKNGGLSDARNAGLDAATGKYIYFLDGDDAIKPELVERVTAYMEEGNDMVSFGYTAVYPEGKTELRHMNEVGVYVLSTMADCKDFLIHTLLTGKIGWEAWNRMYRRDLIEKYGLRFEDNNRIFAEDLYFCVCYCAHARRIRSIYDHLYYYNVRDNSIMGQNANRLNIGRMNELSKAVLAFYRRFDDCTDLVKVFPVIHYLIVRYIYSGGKRKNEESLQAYRARVLADIQDKTYFFEQGDALKQHIKELKGICLRINLRERISFYKYLKHGSYTRLRLQNRIIYLIARYTGGFEQKYPIVDEKQYLKLKCAKRRIFLLGTEEFGNIGDNQINRSVIAFLQREVPEGIVFEVTASEYVSHLPYLEKYIRGKDLIVFAGGGNFGDVYPVAHAIKCDAVKRWPNVEKIVFPQTVHFTDTQQGREELKETQKVFSAGNHVTVFTREEKSFEFVRKNLTCESYLVPDIVLHEDLSVDQRRMNLILMCMRNDLEKQITDEMRMKIEKKVSSYGCAVVHTDLQLPYHVKKRFREGIIEEKLNQWRSARLVITDRLHGMVFAAITGTPCVIFSNYNHKVRGTYEWIKHLPYIRYVESVEEMQACIPQLLAMKDCQYDRTPLMPYYEKLAEVVKEKCR